MFYSVCYITENINKNAEIDTDFDGIDDIEDDMPRSNLYKGVLKCSFEEGINVSFRMNYRNLIDSSNTRYSVQKSELSSIFATLAYGAKINITEGATINGSAEELYTALGLEDFADYSKENKPKIFKDDDITELLIGHRLVRYQGKETEVFIVSIRGTDGSIEEWSSNFDVGANDKVYWDYGNPEWTNYEHHKGFDVAANRCYDLIEDYIEDGIEAKLISDTTKKSILITGHSRGAAIANLLGKKFEEDEEFISTVYTFATPNTTTSENPEKYDTIFNIVNEDDLVPYLPLDAWGFDKYGTTKTVSVKKDYENSWFGAQEGTWEWLINANREDALDYNYNGHKESTLKAFEKMFKTIDEATSEEIRKSIYVIPDDEEAILELDTKYKYWDEASEARDDISEDYGKRLMNGCELYVGFDAGFLGLNPKYKVQVKQSPHFLMMAVAALAAGENPENKDLKAISGLGYAVAKKYNKARVQFIHSAVDSVSDEGVIAGGFVRFGGMAHGHWQETYYLLAKYER